MPEEKSPDQPVDTFSVEQESPRTVVFKLEIVPPDNYHYSNVSAISISPWDIRINFADVSPQHEQAIEKRIADIGIILPPEHAAGLALLLMDQLRLFESQFGPIRHGKWNAMSGAAKQRFKEASAKDRQPEPSPEPSHVKG